MVPLDPHSEVRGGVGLWQQREGQRGQLAAGHRWARLWREERRVYSGTGSKRGLGGRWAGWCWLGWASGPGHRFPLKALAQAFLLDGPLWRQEQPF